MSLFRKKKESFGVDRKVVITFEIFGAIVLFLALLGIKWLYYNVESSVIRLDNQTINDVSFVDFKADYTDDKVLVSVSAINYTEKELNIKNVKIRLYANDNNLISEINVPNIGVLATNQEYFIKNEIVLDVKIASVEYEVE